MSREPASLCLNIVINDQLQPHSGGSTLLWQHLFWFFGHPEVYIAIIPGMGIVSHVLITNMRRPMLSHRVLIYSMGALAVLSYMVYGHHMFVSGMNPFSSLAFSFPTLVITIPSTIVVLIWIGSLYGSSCASIPLPCSHWASFRCSSPAASADSSWRSLRSTSCCMPRISSWVTSTW